MSEITYSTEDRLALAMERLKEVNYLRYRESLARWDILRWDTKDRVLVSLMSREGGGKWKISRALNETLRDSSRIVKDKGIPPESAGNLKGLMEWYEDDFPKDWEIVFMDRSWHNRWLVEPVMWFCSKDQYEEYIWWINEYEEQLTRSGIIYLKVYLWMDRERQTQRLDLREKIYRANWCTLTQVDSTALDKWDLYTWAEGVLFRNVNVHPWIILDTNIIALAGIEIIKALIKTSLEASVQMENISLEPDQRIAWDSENWRAKAEEKWYFDTARTDFPFINTDDSE